MANLRAQLLRIQQENYEKNLRQVKQSLGNNPIVSHYGREYHRYLKTYQSVSTKADLLKHVLSSDIVYHGDYHTLRHSQRSILAMLQEIVGKRELVLCLEMFHGQDQKWVDQFMSGDIEEKTFLKKIGYAHKWAYNWNPWRHILNFCREKKIKVLGINRLVEDPEKSLRERDIYSAQIVGQGLIRYPGALIYVVDGDYHISPNHLPKQVDERLWPLGLAPIRTILYQNAEKLYWQLAAEKKEEAEVLQISGDSFCLMNTVPATKLQSYLDWLDFAEDGYFPVKGNWAELSGENYYSQVQSIIQNLDSLFQFKFPMVSLEHLTVYSSRNLDFTEVIQNTPVLRSHLRVIERKIKRGEGFLLEYREADMDAYLIYLPNSSINQAAEESTHFMNAVLRGPLNKRPQGIDSFYTNVLTEAMGFFGSKMINEKRKAPTESALRHFLGKIKKGSGKEGFSNRNLFETEKVSRLLLQHLHLEKRSSRELDFRKKFSSTYALRSNLPQTFSTQLGYILGNRLYYAVKKGSFPLRDVRNLFYEKFETSGHAFATYTHFIQRLKSIKNLDFGPHEQTHGPLAASA